MKYAAELPGSFRNYQQYFTRNLRMSIVPLKKLLREILSSFICILMYNTTSSTLKGAHGSDMWKHLSPPSLYSEASYSSLVKTLDFSVLHIIRPLTT